jgi:hypothetical protein
MRRLLSLPRELVVLRFCQSLHWLSPLLLGLLCFSRKTQERLGASRLKSHRTSLYEQEGYCSACFVTSSLVQRPKKECTECSPSCYYVHRRRKSAFMDDFADAKDYISISFYMISRDEPKSQWAEKKAHLYETTECFVAEAIPISW